jgi:cytochrome c oxidase subunit 2
VLKRTIFGLVLLVAGTGAPVAAQDAAAGQAAYATCAACHGANGEGMEALNAPAVAGQEQWYIERQLRNFKTGVRGAHADDMFGAQMAPMAQTLATDADIANMAAYMASLTPAPVTDNQGGDATAGAAAFAVCAACHGPDGKGMEALNAPNLTLQQDWYVVRQLQNFKHGVRGAHPEDMFGAQMAPMAITLADEAAMKNLAAYIATLR